MKIYIIEKEQHTNEGIIQEDGIVPCISLEVAIREMEKMIEESGEGKFIYHSREDGLLAVREDGWVWFTITQMNVKE